MCVLSGYSSLKQLAYVLLPALAISFGVAVAVTHMAGHRIHTWEDMWAVNLRIGLLNLHQFIVLASLLNGVALMILNLSVPVVYQCIDPLIRITVAAVKADSAFQWTWVVLAGVGNLVCATLYHSVNQCNSPSEAQDRDLIQQLKKVEALYVEIRWLSLSSQVEAAEVEAAGAEVEAADVKDEAAETEAAGAEAEAAGAGAEGAGAGAEADFASSVLCYILHIPVIFLAMLPACGYVSAGV